MKFQSTAKKMKMKTYTFLNEHMKMAKYNFDFGKTLLNKIMSPGWKLFEGML